MAKLKLVKCCYCGNNINREEDEFVKVSNRYAHKECFDKHELDSEYFKKITDLIKKLYKGKEPNWTLIGSQIKKFKKEGLTYYGIYNTLVYSFLIKGKDINKGVGVGLIPYEYEKAKAYYSNLNNTYSKAESINNSDNKLNENKEEVVIIENNKVEKKLIEFNY